MARKLYVGNLPFTAVMVVEEAKTNAKANER